MLMMNNLRTKFKNKVQFLVKACYSGITAFEMLASIRGEGCFCVLVTCICNRWHGKHFEISEVC